jgi:hypothetical protein
LIEAQHLLLMGHETCFLRRGPLRIIKQPGVSHASLVQQLPHTLPGGVCSHHAEQSHPTAQGV